MDAEHPLFKELRNGLLWHRTSPGDYRQIRIDGAIKVNDGRINRWGQQYACQQLGAISLFDFTTESEDKILWEAIKWQQFLGDFDPVTVLLGIDRLKLTGRLIPYPRNKEGTTGNVIPCVEVCHCGPIPTSVVVSYLLICSVDYARFRKVPILDEATLSLTEKEFCPIVETERWRLASIFANQQEALSRQMHAGFKQPSSHEDLSGSDQRGE
jgi:hypothetical protein